MKNIITMAFMKTLLLYLALFTGLWIKDLNSRFSLRIVWDWEATAMMAAIMVTFVFAAYAKKFIVNRFWGE